MRSLERDGLIARQVQPGVPPQVEYQLTTPGRSLLDPLAMVRSWARQYISEIERARLAYDDTTSSKVSQAGPNNVS